MHLLLPVSLALSVTVSVLGVLFALVSVLMMLIILVQKPKGGGLSGAFGGGGGSGSEGAFMGAKVGDFLTIVTASCFIVFVLLAMGLTWTTTPEAEAATPVVIDGAAGAAGVADAAGEDVDVDEGVDAVNDASAVAAENLGAVPMGIEEPEEADAAIPAPAEIAPSEPEAPAAD